MKRIWPLFLGIATYIGAFGVQLFEVVRSTHGQQLYPLDDVYIHAAVAKNLYLHHVYGISQYHFSFPSSSIAWPFLLALSFALLGVKAWIPLALNFAASIACLWFADVFLRRLAPSISPRMRFACYLLLILGVPLVGLSFEGMEHVLHALSFLMLLYAYNRAQVCGTRRWQVLLALSAAWTVSLRYESLFAVLMIGLLLLWRRKWLQAVGVGACALLPVVAFGAFARMHDSTFLPVPLLLKTSSSTQTSLFTAAEHLFSRYSLLSGITFCFLTAVGFLIYLTWVPSDRTRPMRDLFTILTGTFLLHAQLAHFGWLFRYEAYLLTATIVLVFAATAEILDEPRPFSFPAQWIRVGLVPLLALSLAGRGESMLRGIAKDARAVYEQQYQTARFLRTFYPHQVVGLNDIGAPDFYADIRCLDLLGLASEDVARLRSEGRFTRQAVAEIANQHEMRIAALYPTMFPSQIPYSWIPVSTLVVRDLPGKVQLGDRSVTFYAADEAEAKKLAADIRQFRTQLPSGVQVVAPTAPESAEARAGEPATHFSGSE